jgi:hypothetical protein
MSCTFSMRHYAEILHAAQTGGYRFVHFDKEPEPGDLFLRHDVDLSLDAALEMAELEARLGVRATYFLMTQSVFYNLASAEGEWAAVHLRELGHSVGLHAVYPRADHDVRFDRVMAWHNPDPGYMFGPVGGLVNVMAEPHFSREQYRSDSNHNWRNGCPHADLAAGAFEWLQLLVHPELWAYEGATMRESMDAMLKHEQERDWERLAEDRIDLS